RQAEKQGKPAQITWCISMKKKGIDKSLKAIGGDSTNVNTGCEGGAMHWVRGQARASTLLELIDWAEGVYESPLMHRLTTEEINKFIDE
ncbi:hypothetical protein E2320_021438, partial [Naja naja]